MARNIPDRRIAYRFSVLSTLQTRALAAMYSRKFGLTVNSWWVMVVIGRFPRSSASTVVENTTLEADKVTRAVDMLVDKGLMLRREDPEDRRRVVLTLSASGARVFEEIETVRKALEAELLEVLTNEELESLYTILDKLDSRGRDLFSHKDAWTAIVGNPPPAVRAARPKPAAATRPRPRSKAVTAG